MSSASSRYDIAFIGHMCFDEVVPYQGEPYVALGSAVLCGAQAAARAGKRVIIVTRAAAQEHARLASLKQNNLTLHITASAETTYMKVVHPSADVDERQIYQLKNAGFFSLADLPQLEARRVHLAGITDQEFDLKFIDGLKTKGYHLSADMQSFVRQVQAPLNNVAFRDVPEKKEIVSRLEMVKLDVVEAKVLTGSDNLERAARIIEGWGCPEIIITQAEGVFAQARGKRFYERFSNRSTVGRTGRGDTTFGAYLARRLDHEVAESLKFAAALVSIKMEKPGPFTGTLNDVITRMKERIY